jgi:hypothetical protein
MKSIHFLCLLALFAGAFKSNAQTPCQAAIKFDTTKPYSLIFSCPVAGLAPSTQCIWTTGNCGKFYNTSSPYPNSVIWTISSYLPGKYPICLTLKDSASGCNSSVCDTTIVTGADCTSTFTLSADTSNVHNKWLNLVTNDNLFIAFTWSWGDNTPNDTSTIHGPGPSHTYAIPGTYQLCLKAVDSICSFYCSSTFCDSIHVPANQTLTVNMRRAAPAGILEPSVLQHLDLYPNPSTAQSTLSYGLSKETDTDIRIYDLKGREVMGVQYQRNQQPGEHQISLNAANLPDGTYLIRIQAGVSSSIRRWTIAH